MIDDNFSTSNDKRIFLDKCIKSNSYIKHLEKKLDIINAKVDNGNVVLLDDKKLLEHRLKILSDKVNIYRNEAKTIVNSLYIFPRLKEILNHTALEGYSLKETADIMGLSIRQIERDYNVFITYFEIPKEEYMDLDRVVQDNVELKAKKEYLYRYKRGKNYIDRLEDRLELLTAKIESVNSPKYSDVKVDGWVHKSIDERILDKMELEKRINKLKEDNNIIKYEIYEAIDSLMDERLAECLELLTIKCMSAEDSADYMYISHRQFMRIYKKALENMIIPNQKLVS